MKFTNAIVKTFILSLLIIGQIHFAYAQTASILPPAETTFFDANGNPLSSGTVAFSIPGTTTAKTTWQDAAETIPNANPVVLDAAGKALILGSGSYRQIVKDHLGNLIWDQVTSSPGGSGGGGPTIGDGTNVGTILAWSGFVAPANYVFSNGQAMSRTTFSILMTAITQTQLVTCVGGNSTLTTVSDTSQLPIGAAVEAACIPTGSVVISTTANTVTINNSAIISTTVNAQFFPYGNGDGVATFNIPDLRGRVIPGRNNMGGAATGRLTSTFYGTTPNAIGSSGGSQSTSIALGLDNLPTGIVSSGNNSISVSAQGGFPNLSATNGAVLSSLAATPGGLTVPNASSGSWSSISSMSGPNNIVVTSTNTNGTPFVTSLITPSLTENYIIKVLPDTTIGTSDISQLAPGVGNQLAGTNALGVWGNVTVPSGLIVASNALNFNIPALPVDSSPNANNNFVIEFNAAGNATNRVSLGQIASSATAGVSSLGGATGAITLGTGLSLSGSTLNAAVGGAPNVQTANYTIAPTDCGGTVQMGTGATGFLTLTLTAPANVPEGCTVWVKNGDGWTSRGKSLSGFPSDFTNGQLILWPLQAGAVERINGVWATIVRPGRAKIPFGTQTFNTNFTSGSDAAGVTDCMATGASACKSVQHTLFMGCAEFDFNSTPQTLYTILMASGVTDTNPVHYACPQIPGAQGGAAITINMNGGTIQAGAVGADAVAVDVGATVAIFGGNLLATGIVTGSTRNADCLRADFGGRIFYAGQMTFLSCSGSDLAAENNGYIVVQGNDTISGNGASHFFARGGGVISTDYVTVIISTTLGANISKTSAFALAGPGGTIDVPSWTFLTGGHTNTGAKTATTGTGSINTSPLGTSNNSACNNTYFPGTVNNAVAAPYCN